jgi:hypothetical protein
MYFEKVGGVNNTPLYLVMHRLNFYILRNMIIRQCIWRNVGGYRGTSNDPINSAINVKAIRNGFRIRVDKWTDMTAISCPFCAMPADKAYTFLEVGLSNFVVPVS